MRGPHLVNNQGICLCSIVNFEDNLLSRYLSVSVKVHGLCDCIGTEAAKYIHTRRSQIPLIKKLGKLIMKVYAQFVIWDVDLKQVLLANNVMILACLYLFYETQEVDVPASVPLRDRYALLGRL